MVTFSSGGGFGNRLFQYVSARLLAEKLGYELRTPCPFKGILTPTEPEPGITYNNDKTTLIESTETGDIFKIKWRKQHIHLQGYWQDYNYYIPNREKILDYFLEKAQPEPDQENIIMHVRLGDYKIFGPKGNVLNPKYYLDCLEREKFDKLFIVTDSRDDSYFYPFRKFNPIFTKGIEAQDFWLLTEFDRIICGNSTFSWWAAFLSNASKIYTPKCWIRNSIDIYHELQNINNGKNDGIQMEAGFIDYN